MKSKDKELLEKYGWIVECESPFEVRHTDGSFASMQGAECVLDSCISEDALNEYLEFRRKNKEKLQ